MHVKIHSYLCRTGLLFTLLLGGSGASALAAIAMVPAHSQLYSDFHLSRIETTEEIISPNEVNPTDEVGLNENYQQPILSPDVAATDSGGLWIADIIFKLWDVVVANRPVADVQMKSISALPVIAKSDWAKLSGWKTDRGFKVKVTYANLYGIDVVDFTYSVRMVYGGRYSGQGYYITNARVIASNVTVLWGYDFNMQVEIPAIFNANTEADPLAAVQFDVSWTIDSMLKSDTESRSYQLHGNGLVVDAKNQRVIIKAAL